MRVTKRGENVIAALIAFGSILLAAVADKIAFMY